MENLRKSVFDQLEVMDSNNLVEVYNTYCNLIDDRDNEIQCNDQEGLESLLGCGRDYLSIVCRVFYGDYNPSHEYVKLDGYGNLESFDDPTDHISIIDMIDTIMENLKEFEDLLDLDY